MGSVNRDNPALVAGCIGSGGRLEEDQNVGPNPHADPDLTTNNIEMKVITDGTEQLINLPANDTPLQLPTFRHEVIPSSQSHQVGQTPTRSHHGNEGGPAAQQHQ